MKTMTRTLCLVALISAAACSEDKDGTPAGMDSGVTAGGASGSTNTAPNLYQRLGHEAGIGTVMDDFIGRVLADSKINGYFLNSNVDGGRLKNCLVLQVGNLTGGPQIYPSAGCRDMKTSHAGMRISRRDFDDLAGHLVMALQKAGVAATDVNAIVAAVTPMASDIVEDTANNATVYQRVGRKPAIATVVTDFIGRVVKDTRINGFFTMAKADRLHTCLVRQVCGIDGPCKYGMEVDAAEPGVSRAKPCVDMKSSHAGLTNTQGMGISMADFGALVEDLVAALDAAGVTAADKNALLGVLGSLCPDIVSTPEKCGK